MSSGYFAMVCPFQHWSWRTAPTPFLFYEVFLHAGIDGKRDHPALPAQIPDRLCRRGGRLLLHWPVRPDLSRLGGCRALFNDPGAVSPGVLPLPARQERAHLWDGRGDYRDFHPALVAYVRA